MAAPWKFLPCATCCTPTISCGTCDTPINETIYATKSGDVTNWVFCTDCDVHEWSDLPLVFDPDLSTACADPADGYCACVWAAAPLAFCSGTWKREFWLWDDRIFNWRDGASIYGVFREGPSDYQLEYVITWDPATFTCAVLDGALLDFDSYIGSQCHFDTTAVTINF